MWNRTDYLGDIKARLKRLQKGDELPADQSEPESKPPSTGAPDLLADAGICTRSR